MLACSSLRSRSAWRARVSPIVSKFEAPSFAKRLKRILSELAMTPYFAMSARSTAMKRSRTTGEAPTKAARKAVLFAHAA
jgi:hypothetical protein